MPDKSGASQNADVGLDHADQMVRQNRAQERWLRHPSRADLKQQHLESGHPTPVDPNTKRKTNGGWDSIDVDDDAWERATALDKGESTAQHLFRAYKASPHQPPAVVAKYFVHRFNNLAAYDDPETGHTLDRDFLKLIQTGEANSRTKHLTSKQLHLWVQKNPRLMQDLLDHRQELHNDILGGCGLNTRLINGETHVALTRGLDTHLMTQEHALSSFADQVDTGFGSNMHHAWVPLKDIWFAYPHFHRSYCDDNHENEYLVSNSGTRYEARAEDIRRSILNNGSSWWRGLKKGDLASRRRHFDKFKEDLARTDSESARAKTLTSEDLNLIADRVPPDDHMGVTRLTMHPNATSAHMERLWRRIKPEEAPQPLVESNLVSGSLLDEMVDWATKNHSNRKPLNHIDWLAGNPNLTEQQADRLFRAQQAVTAVGMGNQMVANAPLSAAAVESLASKCRNPINHQQHVGTKNLLTEMLLHNHRLSDEAIEAALDRFGSSSVGVDDLQTNADDLSRRMVNIGISPRLQAVAYRLFNHPRNSNNIESQLRDLAQQKNLSPEIISLLANHTSPKVRKAVLSNRKVPIALLHESLPADAKSVAYRDIQKAIQFRLQYEKDRSEKHLIKPLPAGLAKGEQPNLAHLIDEASNDPELRGHVDSEDGAYRHPILDHAGKPVGFFTPRTEDGVIRAGATYITPAARGNGHAGRALKQYIGDKPARAFIATNNIGSQRAFGAAGFIRQQVEERWGGGHWWRNPAEIAAHAERNKLGKSSDDDQQAVWLSQLHGWIAERKREVPGWMTIMPIVAAAQHLADRLIPTEVTDEVVEGKAVTAWPSSIPLYQELQLALPPGSQLVFFRTDQPPRGKLPDGRAYWVEAVPCSEVNIGALEKAEPPKAKKPRKKAPKSEPKVEVVPAPAIAPLPPQPKLYWSGEPYDSKPNHEIEFPLPAWGSHAPDLKDDWKPTTHIQGKPIWDYDQEDVDGNRADDFTRNQSALIKLGGAVVAMVGARNPVGNRLGGAIDRALPLPEARAHHTWAGKIVMGRQDASDFAKVLSDADSGANLWDYDDAVTVYLHEAMHGASQYHDYDSDSAKALEEATTEILAQHYTPEFIRHILGSDRTPWKWGDGGGLLHAENSYDKDDYPGGVYPDDLPEGAKRPQLIQARRACAYVGWVQRFGALVAHIEGLDDPTYSDNKPDNTVVGLEGKRKQLNHMVVWYALQCKKLSHSERLKFLSQMFLHRRFGLLPPASTDRHRYVWAARKFSHILHPTTGSSGWFDLKTPIRGGMFDSLVREMHFHLLDAPTHILEDENPYYYQSPMGGLDYERHDNK
jgi:hypothetical protein